MKTAHLITWLLLAIASSLPAKDFAQFEKEVLMTHPRLLADKLELKSAALEGERAMLYDNPSVEIETGRFDTKESGADVGWRLGLSQPFRLPTLGDELRDYAQSLEKVARATFTDRKSRFRHALRTHYLAWVKAAKTVALQTEALALCTKLRTIAYERYEAGAGTKVHAIQADLRCRRLADALQLQKIQAQEKKARLAAFAGLDASDLTPKFLYDRSEIPGQKSVTPAVDRLIARANLQSTVAKTEDHLIKRFTITGEYEKEPDQKIARIALQLPIPLFNRNRQTYRLAMLASKKEALQAKYMAQKVAFRKASLIERFQSLASLLGRIDEAIERQRSLIALYEEGYKNARSGLLELIAAQEGLIDAKKRRLTTRILMDAMRDNLEALQGYTR